LIKSKEGLIEIEIELENERNPYIKDYLLFKDVKVMTKINYNENNKKIFKIKSKNTNSFYIGDTSNFSEYILQ
jgi:hypothetical protein